VTSALLLTLATILPVEAPPPPKVLHAPVAERGISDALILTARHGYKRAYYLGSTYQHKDGKWAISAWRLNADTGKYVEGKETIRTRFERLY
jgi:hypothetical protein